MCCQKEPYILVFGVSVYDIVGFSNQNFKAKDSNPGRVRVSYGGVCRNIAENLARLQIKTKFLSPIGDDEKGKSILKHAQEMNIDMEDSFIAKGKSTPTYMAILNEHGEMEAAIVDMSITDCITKEYIDSKAELIKNAEYVVLDTDHPSIVEHILTTHKGHIKCILDPVSVAKVSRVKHLLSYFHTIKPNRQEAEELCGFEIKTIEDVRKAGKYFLGLGIKNVMISLDADGMYYNDGTQEGIIKSKEVSVVNVTGAGDSCVAGIGYGYMNQFNIQDTVRYAIAMSVITIAHEETIHPGMCCDLVKEYISKIKWEETTF